MKRILSLALLLSGAFAATQIFAASAQARIDVISPRLLEAVSKLHTNQSQMSQQLQLEWCMLNGDLIGAVISPTELQNNDARALFIEELTLNLEGLLQQHRVNLAQRTNYACETEMEAELGRWIAEINCNPALLKSVQERIDVISSRLFQAVKTLEVNQYKMSEQLQLEWGLLRQELTSAAISQVRFKDKNGERAQFLEELTLNLEGVLQQHQANLTQHTNMEI